MLENKNNGQTNTAEDMANVASNKLVSCFEDVVARAQRKEDILFYGKIVLGIAAIAGISYFAYDRFFSSDEKLIVVSDAASL